MNKKLISILLTGAVIATSAAGFTACSDGKLSEEEWKAAIAASAAAENFTATAESKTVYSFKGEADGETVDYNYSEIYSVSVRYDWTHKEVYQEVLNAYKSTGGESVGRDDVDEKKKYEIYSKAEGPILKTAENTPDDGWEAYAEYFGSQTSLKKHIDEGVGIASVFDSFYYADKNGGALATLSEAYPLLAYADGVYAAELYVVTPYIDGEEEKVTVRIESGFLTALNFSAAETTETEEGMTETITVSTAYTFSYGSTEANPPEEAVEAVDSVNFLTPVDPENSLVADKTFSFESAELVFDGVEDGSGEWKIYLASLRDQYEGANLSFGVYGDFLLTLNADEELTFVEGTFTEDGGTVTAMPETVNGEPAGPDTVPMAFVCNDGTLTISEEISDGVTVILVYKLSVEE